MRHPLTRRAGRDEETDAEPLSNALFLIVFMFWRTLCMVSDVTRRRERRVHQPSCENMGSRFHNRGISLIEVVIAFAATAVIVGATLPDFHDNTVRARVAETLRAAETPRQALVASCVADGRAVIRREQALAERDETNAPGREPAGRIELSADCPQNDLRVVVRTARTGASPDPVFEYTAQWPDGSGDGRFAPPADWACRLLQGDAAYAPPGCGAGNDRG